ncbi:MAG: adenylyltransferase/cytidyltransferase family protein [Nitrososphaeraceae archaeon]
MKTIDKVILGTLFINGLDRNMSFLQVIKEKYKHDEETLRKSIDELINLGLIEKKHQILKLTQIGRESLKVVLVGGVFDLLHPGHISTLKSAKALGDILIVIIATTKTATKIKKDRIIYHNENLRKEMVSSLSFVDLALIGKKGTLFDTVEYVKPDIIALGYDQTHTEKEISENCKKRKLEIQILRLSTPVPKIKSSEIKKELGEAFYKI